MNIVINTRQLFRDRLEGIGWFTYHTLKRLTAAHPECRFTFLFDRPFAREFVFNSNVKPVVAGPQARHPFLWFWWYEHSVPSILQKEKADLFYSPDNYISLNTPVKSIITLHDLNFFHYPQNFRSLEKKYLNYYTPLFAKKADRIVTVSEYSKQDISDCYQISKDKIDVVYNGLNEVYKPLSEGEKKVVRHQYAHSAPYFVYVGAMNPRKNVSRMLQAYDEFRKSTPSDIKMLIVGRKMFNTQNIVKTHRRMQFRDDVLFVGHLPVNELAKVTAAAEALILVSYYEGFGVPLIEAMQCEVPVITSNVTSMPEVAGDAALLTDPFSVDSIKNAMQQIAMNKDLQKQLIQKGNIQKEKFNWDHSAEQLWQSFDKVLGR